MVTRLQPYHQRIRDCSNYQHRYRGRHRRRNLNRPLLRQYNSNRWRCKRYLEKPQRLKCLARPRTSAIWEALDIEFYTIRQHSRESGRLLQQDPRIMYQLAPARKRLKDGLLMCVAVSANYYSHVRKWDNIPTDSCSQHWSMFVTLSHFCCYLLFSLYIDSSSSLYVSLAVYDEVYISLFRLIMM